VSDSSELHPPVSDSSELHPSVSDSSELHPSVSDSSELSFLFLDCHHTSYDYDCMQSSSHPARSRDLSVAFSSIFHLLRPPSPNTIFPFDFPLIYMMFYHPAALVLLMQQVQRLAIEREIRIVDVDRHLPEP